jgi:hypothetical protein
MATRSYPKLTEGALADHLARELRYARLDGARDVSRGPKRAWRVWVALELAPARNGSDRLGVHGREAPPRGARLAEEPHPAANLERGIVRRLAHRSTENVSQAAMRRQRLREMYKSGRLTRVLLPARDGAAPPVASAAPSAPVERQRPKPSVRSCRVLNGHPVRRQPGSLGPTRQLAKPHRARR